MPYVQTSDGASLFYNDWGSGKPVVLIHGWPLDADMWEYQSVRLAESGHRVIAYDRRGFGRSSQPWNGYDYDTLASDLSAVLGAANVEGATLIGFSMGGGEVVRYLGKTGGARVAKAVLVSSIAPYMLKTSDNPEGVGQEQFEQIIGGLRTDRPHFLSGFGDTFYGVGMISSPVSKELLQWSLQVAMLASPRATIECVKAFGMTDLRADTAHVKTPTLIIHGDADQTVPVAMAHNAHRLIEGSSLKIYPGAPHGLFATHPHELLRDLEAFI